MSIEKRLRDLANRIETVQEHYKDYEPSEEELNNINKLVLLISDLEELYKDQQHG